jgi:DNA-binding CsgD family transcriptional regulator
MAKQGRYPQKLVPPAGLEAYRLEVGGEELVVFRLPATEVRSPGKLSDAEREVARLVVEGLTNGAIAERRGTSLRTVANQLASIFRKLDVRSRSELVTRLLGEER